MNPYEVGKPDAPHAESGKVEVEPDPPYDPRLFRLFFASAVRITIYGIMALLLLVVVVYWVG